MLEVILIRKIIQLPAASDCFFKRSIPIFFLANVACCDAVFIKVYFDPLLFF